MHRGVIGQSRQHPLPFVVAVFFVVSLVLSACSNETSSAGGNSAETGSPELAGVLALADGRAGMDVGAALTYKEGARVDELAVGALDAEPLGLGVPAVAGGTHTFFMSEKLKIYF